MSKRTGSFRRIRKTILDRDGWRCVYCDGALNDFTASIDHVEKRADGGSNGASNLVASCRYCNNEREELNLTAAEYMARRK